MTNRNLEEILRKLANNQTNEILEENLKGELIIPSKRFPNFLKKMNKIINNGKNKN